MPREKRNVFVEEDKLMYFSILHDRKTNPNFLKQCRTCVSMTWTLSYLNG